MEATVLFVDDNPRITQLAAEALSVLRPAWKTITAHSLNEARRVKGRFHATVLDYKLTDGDGFELLHEFRRQDPRLPVVMTSGYQFDVVRSAGAEYGHEPYAFFEKPFSFEELVGVLEREMNSACLVKNSNGACEQIAPAPTRALALRENSLYWMHRQREA